MPESVIGRSSPIRERCGALAPVTISTSNTESPCTVPLARKVPAGDVSDAVKDRRRKSRLMRVSVTSSVRCTAPSASMSTVISSWARIASGRVSTVLIA